MKRPILLLFLSSFFTGSYSQSSEPSRENLISQSIGIISNVGICKLSRSQDLFGITSSHGKLVISYGLCYMRSISNKLKLETGISYSRYTIIDHLILVPNVNANLKEYFNIISIPVMFKYHFPKLYYLSAGPIIDLVVSRSGDVRITDSQNGIGIGTSIGKEVLLNKFLLFIEPNFNLY